MEIIKLLIKIVYYVSEEKTYYPLPLRQKGGAGVIFACLADMKVFFCSGTTAFYRMKLPPCQKIINFLREAFGQLPYRNIQREFGQNLVFLFHIFLFFFTLDAQKLV